MQYINPLNFLGTAILGAALLWAVKLAYGRRRATSDDLVKRLMLLAGWMLLLTGTVGVVVGLVRALCTGTVAGGRCGRGRVFQVHDGGTKSPVMGLGGCGGERHSAGASRAGVRRRTRRADRRAGFSFGGHARIGRAAAARPGPDAEPAAGRRAVGGASGPGDRPLGAGAADVDPAQRDVRPDDARGVRADLLSGGRGPGRHDCGQFCDAQDRARVREDVLRIRTRAAGGHPVDDRDRRPVGLRDPARLPRTADHAAVGLFVFHPLVAVRVARLEPVLAAQRRCAGHASPVVRRATGAGTGPGRAFAGRAVSAAQCGTPLGTGRSGHRSRDGLV